MSKSKSKQKQKQKSTPALTLKGRLEVTRSGMGYVIVDAEKATDERASQLSFDISQKIEKDMQYPGQIKVTVIREMRSVAYAK
jgi:hypothetical protein